MKSAMTSSPLRVAIIGAGQVADKVHASYYCTRNDLELVAVCDSRLSQAQALAEKIRECIRVGRSAGHAAGGET